MHATHWQVKQQAVTGSLTSISTRCQPRRAETVILLIQPQLFCRLCVVSFTQHVPAAREFFSSLSPSVSCISQTKGQILHRDLCTSLLTAVCGAAPGSSFLMRYKFWKKVSSLRLMAVFCSQSMNSLSSACTIRAEDFTGVASWCAYGCKQVGSLGANHGCFVPSVHENSVHPPATIWQDLNDVAIWCNKLLPAGCEEYRSVISLSIYLHHCSRCWGCWLLCLTQIYLSVMCHTAVQPSFLVLMGADHAPNAMDF